MSHPQRRAPITVDEFYRLANDGTKQELQAGTLVSEPLPGSRHGRIAMRIGTLIDSHVRAHGLGVVLGNDSGFILARSPDTVRGPDVAFVTRERYERVGDPVAAFPGAPDLAVEVLSPSDAASGVRAKVAEYLAAGSRCVWVLDPAQRSATEYRSLFSPRILSGVEHLECEEVLPGLRIRVSDIFEL